MSHLKDCADCGKPHLSCLLVCMECFYRVMRTDDARFPRAWLKADREPGEPLSDYAWRMATQLVHVGTPAEGCVKSEPFRIYVGDAILWDVPTVEVGETMAQGFREAVSAMICSVLHEHVRGGE